MMFRRIALFLLCTLTLSADAAMVRVTAIQDGRTISVNRGGKIESIRLAGVRINDEVRSRELLRWTLDNAWVLIEPAGDGWKVWRSPDALFINRELVTRGYASPTIDGIAPAPQANVTYLGEINPPATDTGRPAKRTADTGKPAKRTGTSTKRVNAPAKAPRTGTGTSPRSKASPSGPAPVPRRPSASGANR